MLTRFYKIYYITHTLTYVSGRLAVDSAIIGTEKAQKMINFIMARSRLVTLVLMESSVS